MDEFMKKSLLEKDPFTREQSMANVLWYKYKTFATSTCPVEAFAEYFSKYKNGDCMQGSALTAFTVIMRDCDDEGIRFEICAKNQEMFNVAEYKIVMIPYMNRRIPNKIDDVEFVRVRRTFEHVREVQKPEFSKEAEEWAAGMVNRMQLASMNRNNLLINADQHVPTPKVCMSEIQNQDISMQLRPVNFNSFALIPPDSVLVDPTNLDVSWVEELDEEVQKNLYLKLCELGINYLV